MSELATKLNTLWQASLTCRKSWGYEMDSLLRVGATKGDNKLGILLLEPLGRFSKLSPEIRIIVYLEKIAHIYKWKSTLFLFFQLKKLACKAVGFKKVWQYW